MEKQTFAELGIDPGLIKAIAALGFEQPSPIQAQAIPVALTGRDIVGQSQTGSGKTMAFGIPVVQRIDPALRAIQALILCPTRELAMQVCSEIHKIAEFKGVRATPVYGGASYDRQIRALQGGAQIVVGTPGRVVDMMDRGLIKVEKLKTLVFDEADEMLDMGFRDEIDQVMKAVPVERQTIFFSATFDPRIRDLIRRFTKDPATITIEHKALTVPTVEQRYYEVQGRSKTEVLCRLLDMETPRLTIVFANTKRAVDDTVDALVARGYAADRLHGDLNQMMRERVMRNFRSGNVEVLVATDVAARGLDVNDIDLIVNFELPYDEEDYVHRIGRTGRAGRKGMAISFVGGREIYLMQRIQRFINIKITRHKVPSQEEVEANRVDQTFEKLKAVMESGSFASHDATIQRLLDIGFTPTDICSAILDLWMKESGREGEQIMEDRQPKQKFAPQQREFVPREPRPQVQAAVRAPEQTQAASQTHSASQPHVAAKSQAPVQPQPIAAQQPAVQPQAPVETASVAPQVAVEPQTSTEAQALAAPQAIAEPQPIVQQPDPAQLQVVEPSRDEVVPPQEIQFASGDIALPDSTPEASAPVPAPSVEASSQPDASADAAPAPEATAMLAAAHAEAQPQSDAAPIVPAAETTHAPSAQTVPQRPVHAVPAERSAPPPSRFAQPAREDFDEAPRRSRSFVQKGPRSGMVRLFINLGSMDNTRPGDIAGLVYNTAKIPPGSIGTIDVYEKCSYLEVPADHVETVMSTVGGALVRGRAVRLDLADNQESSMQRPRRNFGAPPRQSDGPPRPFGDKRPPFRKFGPGGSGGGGGDRSFGDKPPFKGRQRY